MSALLIAALALTPAIVAPPPPGMAVRMAGIELAQLSFHSRMVIRVETARITAVPLRQASREKKGPKCLSMADIAGAAIVAPGSVDLVMRGGARLRARFASTCPALDYYSGFYIAPPGDARICAGRDVVRDRAGGECAINRFRRLVPADAP